MSCYLAGFAVCCNAGNCSATSQQPHKWWCERCLLKTPSGWPGDCFTELNIASPGDSKQDLDWKCPHCTNPGACPSAHCTSVQPEKPPSNTQTSRVNPHHGAPPPPPSARVPIEQQKDAAFRLWDEGKVDVCQLSSSVVALPAWDAKKCCFRQVEAPAVGHATLPMIVRMRGPGDIVCEGATDACTCWPRGQCVHILLCQEKELLHLPEVPSLPQPPPADSAGPSSSEVSMQRCPNLHVVLQLPSSAGVCCLVVVAPRANDTIMQHESVAACRVHLIAPLILQGARGEGDIDASEDGEAGGEPSTAAWMYNGNAPAIPAGQLDAAGDASWVNSIFFVSAGHDSDPTSVNWVHVNNAHWKCYQREHRSGSDEHHLCGCMVTVMDALGLTAEDLAMSAAEAAELNAALSQCAASPSVSSLPRTTHMHLSAPCINKYCVPEVVAVALGEAGLPLSAIQAKPSGEEVLSMLGERFHGQVCPEHATPYTITRHKARVTDGATNDMQYCDVFSMCCTVADGQDPCTHVYDGDKDDLFNLNNSELFTHRMLINCLNDVRYKGSSFNAIRQVAQAQQRALPPDFQQAMVSLPLFLRAFFGFMELLTELPGFVCEICGEFRAAIIADGTGYKVFDRHLQPLRSFGHPSHGEQPRVRCCFLQHSSTVLYI
jgi:hypothetical protein